MRFAILLIPAVVFPAAYADLPFSLRQQRNQGSPSSKITATKVSSSSAHFQKQDRVVKQKPLHPNSTHTISIKTENVVIRSLYATASVVLAVTAWQTRQQWIPLLNKDTIQKATMERLIRLKPDDPSQEYKSLIIYSLSMAVVEFFGLSTIPVETAAAAVFGWKALSYSISGKITGAVLAYILGKTILSSYFRKMLQVHPVFGDANQNQTHPAAATALLIKFSCFPELVKNYGSALFPKVTIFHFVAATLFHGGMFSCLWTWLGVVSSSDGPIPKGLSVALLCGMVIGFVISPLLMTWWIRDLARQATKV